MFPKETRVLVVDDMASMRQVVKGQLRRIGFNNIFDADDGAKAFALVEIQLQQNEPIGLILSDWNMPGTPGIEFLKNIRANPATAKLPFIMITAEGEKGQILEAIKLGVSQYLVKPFTPATFDEKLLAVWKKHNPG